MPQLSMIRAIHFRAPKRSSSRLEGTVGNEVADDQERNQAFRDLGEGSVLLVTV